MSDRFRCWCPDMGHDSHEDGDTIQGYDVANAAENYVEKNFSDWSYPRSADVMVQGEDGKVWAVNVEVESVPSFQAAAPKPVE